MEQFIHFINTWALFIFSPLSAEPSYKAVESFRNRRTDEAFTTLYPPGTFDSVTPKEIANSQKGGRYRRDIQGNTH